MKKPTLTIFYQFNPWSSSIGGIQTVIRYFIKYAPQSFNIRLVGTETDKGRPLGKWYRREFEGRDLEFFPLIFLQNDDVRQLLPTSVRYTVALINKNLSSDFMHFHRMEPAMATFRWSGEKSLFVHNDIHQQIRSADAEDGILWKKFPKAYFAMEKALIGQFDHILSCNSESIVLYKQQYPNLASRVDFVRNSFDGRVFYPLEPDEREAKRQQLAKKMGLTAETQFLLFAGRLHPQKDPLLLVQAIAALDNPRVHLLIAGDGELSEATRDEISKLNLGDRISMLGSQPQGDIADLQRIASAFVLTSVYEGLPLVVLESLACGTPIVTTDAGETPRLLDRQSGIVCENRTASCIAAALEDLLARPGDFPPSSCVQAAAEFSAEKVIGDQFKAMLQRWKRRQ